MTLPGAAAVVRRRQHDLPEQERAKQVSLWFPWGEEYGQSILQNTSAS